MKLSLRYFRLTNGGSIFFYKNNKQRRDSTLVKYVLRHSMTSFKFSRIFKIRYLDDLIFLKDSSVIISGGLTYPTVHRNGTLAAYFYINEHIFYKNNKKIN